MRGSGVLAWVPVVAVAVPCLAGDGPHLDAHHVEQRVRRDLRHFRRRTALGAGVQVLRWGRTALQGSHLAFERIDARWQGSQRLPERNLVEDFQDV